MANNHHFLPQMYLRRWTTSVDPPMEPFVYAYYRGQTDPKRKAPQNIGYVPGLYALNPNWVADGDPEALEKLFSRLEGRARSAFGFIDRHRHLQHVEHREAIAHFVAAMFLRTHKEQLAEARRALEWVDELVADQIEELGGLDSVRRLIERFGGGPEDTSDAGLLQFMTAVATRVATERKYRLMRLPASCEKIAGHFLAMHFCVTLAPPLQQFVTSDSPVLLPTMNEPPHWWRTHEVGIGQDGAEIWFPLDPDKALLVTRKPVPLTMFLGAGQLEEINRLCMRRSLEFVITHRRRPQIAAFVAAQCAIEQENRGA
ncbi:MAG: DUF4238 domain-containing protein [Planctomycetaceae bacterium]|nr:DUF4238 domain-containing protein [Planctomycetota bacterium]NUN51210.1 DUF4238 domain-containing protein [Planctomycetaceae bacterium]